MIDKRIKFAKPFFILSFVGLIAGFFNGLLGSGGGVILILSLSKILKNQEKSKIFATSLFSLIPISALSFVFYLLNTDIQIDSTLLLILIPSLIGGYVGSLLLKKIKGKFLSLLFSLILIYSGIRMILR